MTQQHQYQDLITLFDQCFYEQYQTRLIKGGDEPIYLPRDKQTPYDQVIFAHGYYASALHEISHWCIAGAERRRLEDFGYWYCADGRDEATQEAFQKVELLPQALDWLFCIAANYPFNVSCDNLKGSFEPDRIAFQQQVHGKVMELFENNTIPKRAQQFLQALRRFYATDSLTKEQFYCPEPLFY